MSSVSDLFTRLRRRNKTVDGKISCLELLVYLLVYDDRVELPSFASQAKKSLYSDLLMICRNQIDLSPIFWNWVSAGFLTAPTLKKIFILKELIDRTNSLKGPIYELGSGLGTKVFALLNIQSVASNDLRPIFAFDSLLGYSESGLLSLASHEEEVCGHYESMNLLLKRLYSKDYDLVNFSQGELPEVLLESDNREKVSLCFIDVQGSDLTISMLKWALANLELGGIVIIEGANSPHFPALSDSLRNFKIPNNFKVLDLGWEFTLMLQRIDILV